MTGRERERLEADLSAYLDGELSATRTREVEHLLRESPEAQQLLDELRDVADLVADLPRKSAPAGLSATMTHQTERQLLFGEQPQRRRRSVLRLLVKVSASAAVIAACALVGYHALVPALQSTGSMLDEPAEEGAAPLAGATELDGRRGRGAGGAASVTRGLEDGTAFARGKVDGDRDAAPTGERTSGMPKVDLGITSGDTLVDASDTRSENLTDADKRGPTPSIACVKMFGVDDDAAPVVEVVVQAESPGQFYANQAVLADWERRDELTAESHIGGGGAAYRMGMDPDGAPTTQPAIARQDSAETGLSLYGMDEVTFQRMDRSYAVRDVELSARFSDLLAVNDRRQVRVSTAVGADNGEVMLQVAQALQAPSRRADHGGPPADRLAPPAASPSVAVRARTPAHDEESEAARAPANAAPARQRGGRPALQTQPTAERSRADRVLERCVPDSPPAATPPALGAPVKPQPPTAAPPPPIAAEDAQTFGHWNFSTWPRTMEDAWDTLMFFAWEAPSWAALPAEAPIAATDADEQLLTLRVTLLPPPFAATQPGPVDTQPAASRPATPASPPTSPTE